jgi:hypothetical protein
MRVLLACDIGAAVGLGHWRRVSALRAALRERGAATEVLAFGDLPADRSRFGDARAVADDGRFAEHILAELARTSADAIVLDLHPSRIDHALESLLDDLGRLGVMRIGIDSLRKQAALLELLCIPSFHLDAGTAPGHEGKLVWGWDSLLVENQLPVREWSPGRRILVLTGGSDTTGLATTLPAMLEASLPDGVHVDWVRGPYARDPDVPKATRLDWSVHHAPDGLDRLMSTADYALTVFGVSLLELMKYGVPTVVFSPYGGANDVELQVLRSTGACLVASNAGEAAGKLAQVMGNHELARRFSLESRRLLAASGPGRLAQRIVELTSR